MTEPASKYSFTKRELSLAASNPNLRGAVKIHLELYVLPAALVALSKKQMLDKNKNTD
tara:strand:+ start:8242 stop:8415 length:174 start_codon:yes stop_codon:yes gene_type:complete